MVVSNIPCQYCGEPNNDYYQNESKILIVRNVHRIYIRSKDKGRKFILIGNYCTQCMLFELDKTMTESFKLYQRVRYNVKTDEEAYEKAREENPKYFKLLDKMKEFWNDPQVPQPTAQKEINK